MALSQLIGWTRGVSAGPAAACGTTDKPEAPAACGTACGAGDSPKEPPAACGAGGQ